MGKVAHDLEESLQRARAVLNVGRSAQLFHVRLDQGDGLSRGLATSCSHLEVLLSPLEECSHHRLLLPDLGSLPPYLGLLSPYVGLLLPYLGLELLAVKVAMVGKLVAVHIVGTKCQRIHK